MRGEERLARELAEAMRAELGGSGITIREERTIFRVYGDRHDRSCEVHCFWHEDLAGRGVGSGAEVVRFGQVSTGLPRTPPPRGADYLLVLRAGETCVAEGRAHSTAEVIACVRAWVLDRSPIEALYEPFPFVERARRSLARVAAKIDAGLRSVPPVRVVVERAWSSHSLWAYGEGRSCTIEVGDAGSACAFLIHQNQAAHLIAPEHEISGAVAAWTQEQVELDTLRRRHPALVIEPHGELLAAGDVARWHWINLLERARDPEADPILHAYLPLIERILERSSILSFFAFFSHWNLCFSSSSNYPFVTAGLPVLLPAEGARYVVECRGERREADVAQTLEMIDAALAAAPHRPLQGSMPHLLQPLVNAELARQGSSLRVELRQHCQWYLASLQSERRTCEIDATETAAFCEEPAGEIGYVRFPDLAAMVRAARRWLEDAASLEEMRAEVATWEPSRKVQRERRREERRRARDRQGPD